MSSASSDRREFLRELGMGAAALPFLAGLPSLHADEGPMGRRQRLIVMFSPNGSRLLTTICLLK